MAEKEYTVYINNLKISGNAKDIFELSQIFYHASCNYRDTRISIMNSDIIDKSESNELIDKIKDQEERLDIARKEMVKTIQDSEYYKQYISERNELLRNVINKMDME